MKQWKLPSFCGMVLICIAANVAGRMLTSAAGMPFWLDSLGTVFCAYMAGPACGAAVGLTGSLIWSMMRPEASPLYGLVGIATGIIVGVLTRKGGLKNLLGALTGGILLAAAAILIASPLNILLNHSEVGNIWGDALRGFMQERSLPGWLCMMLGEFYVDFIDKLLTLCLLLLAVRAGTALRKRKTKKTGEDGQDGDAAGAADAGGAVPAQALAFLLAAGSLLCGIRAEADAPHSPFDDYVQTIYSSDNGLPCGEANDIAQTNDGILWIGTYAGLYRYNGKEFRWMDFESVRNVNCLYVDEEGRLWIGSNDNGLSIAIGERIVNVVDQSMGLPANSVRSIVQSSDGYYYVGTTSSMKIMTLNSGLKQLNVLQEVSYADHIDADEEGHVAAVTAGGTLYLMQQGRILSSLQITDRQTQYKACVFDPDGYLMATTTGNEIHIFDIREGWFHLIRKLTCGELRNLKDIRYLKSGIMFVTADNGVGYVTDDGTFEKVNTNDFNNSIDKLLEDYQGNLWFTSSRLGLLRMAPSDFRDLYSSIGAAPKVANTVTRWQNCIYIGTDKGLDAVDLSGRRRVENALTEQLNGVRIRCMIADTRDHLWICTYGSGLLEVEPDGTQRLYNEENGGFGNRARVVSELSDGTILAAGDTGISFIRDGQVTDTIRYADGQITSMILTLTEMEDGRILAGTDGNGVAVLENRTVARMLTREDGLSSEVILRSVPDRAGGGVFLVTSNGLCYMEKDETIRALTYFPYFNNYDIWTQDGEKLFVMSSAGVYVANRTELLSGKADIHAELLDSRRGLNCSLTANSWVWADENGNLYLPCDRGVFVINVDRYSGGTKSFRMTIPDIRVDGVTERVDQNRPIRIPRGTSKVEFFPEVINYTIQDPYVGYMMEGFESAWTVVPQNALNQIVYTNLPNGSYTFHLAVFDSSRENILAERTYTVQKDPAFYDRPWFMIYVLLVPMIFVGWITWMLVKRREERIEQELAEANQKVQMGRQTVVAIAKAVDAKDQLTAQHSSRVAMYSYMIAKEYGLSEEKCRDLRTTAQMHDIGKIAIPDKVLKKPGRLTDEEYAVMKSHTTEGAEILKDFTLLDHVVEGAEFHHERYDGRGYPKGLKGEEIPLYARIIGVADAFDAMTANRVYRKKMDIGYVLGELEKGRGTQFDPQFVDILLNLIREGKINLEELYGKEDEKE